MSLSFKDKAKILSAVFEGTRVSAKKIDPFRDM